MWRRASLCDTKLHKGPVGLEAVKMVHIHMDKLLSTVIHMDFETRLSLHLHSIQSTLTLLHKLFTNV